IPQVAETPGIYRLEIHTLAKAPPGQYEIRLAELRPATEGDRALQKARTLFSQYMLLREQGKWSETKPLIMQVLEIREKLLPPDDRLLANTLSFVSNSFDDEGDYAGAELYDLRALRIYENALGPDHPDLALELMHLGNDFLARGSPVRA